MPSATTVNGFLDKVYTAAAVPELWPDAVDEFRLLLRQEVGEVMSHLTVIDLETGLPSHNMISGADPELIREGQSYYFRQDTWASAGSHRFAAAARNGEQNLVIVSPEIIERGALESTEFYQDFLRRFGLTDMICATSIIDRRTVASLVANPIHSRRFEQGDKNLVLQLLPHVDRAFRLSAKLGYTEHARAVSTLWETSRLPVFLLHARRLAYANPSALSLLGSSSVVSKSGAGVSFTDESANAALKALSRKPVESGATEVRQAAFILQSSGRERWMLQMVRIAGSGKVFGGDPAVLLILTPLSATSAMRTGSIESLSGITNEERRILSALVDGKTIRQIARATGRSEATLRWHVRNLLSKTGLRTMTDLVRFAALLLPF